MKQCRPLTKLLNFVPVAFYCVLAGCAPNTNQAGAPVSSIPTPLSTLSATTTITSDTFVCPNIPVYPGAARQKYQRLFDGERRVAIYTTPDSPENVRNWFLQALQPPVWDFMVTNTERLRFHYRDTNEENPSMELLIDIGPSTVEKTSFQVTFIISHPHRSDNWCPELEP